MTGASALAAAADPPQWLGILLSILPFLGGFGGVAAIATVLVQRSKFKADTAGVLTGTALTLVQPLQNRVKELEDRALVARSQSDAAQHELRELRTSVRHLKQLAEQWCSGDTDPQLALEDLQSSLTRIRLDTE